MTTQEKIYAESLNLFLKEGLANVSMRKIGAAVGISAAALYRHYPSKEHLMGSLLQEGFQKFYQYEMRAISGKDPYTRMMLLCENYLQFAVENPGFYKLMMMTEWGDDDTVIHEILGQKAWSTLQFVEDRIRECQQAGIMKAHDAGSLAVTFWAVTHGVVSLGLTCALEGKGIDYRHQFRATIHHVLGGMLTPEGEKLMAHNQVVT
jgi:AcrR family transcriptional regulator